MVSCKVCWSVKWLDWAGVGSRIVILLSHVRNHDTLRTYICWLPNQICDLLRLRRPSVPQMTAFYPSVHNGEVKQVVNGLQGVVGQVLCFINEQNRGDT